ncbi:MAG: hypothetical protein QM689_00855 [Oscillospiraceae bacterium]
MRKYKPNKSALSFIRLLIFLACAAACYAANRYLEAYPILMYCVYAICAGVFVTVGIFLLPVYFAKTSYLISADDITKISGLFVVRKDYMLTGSIQYLTTVTIPFSRFTALNFIIVNALGGKVLLAFLRSNEVIEISATLNHAIRKRK